MSLSDAMSASGLSAFAEIGFVVSFLLFLTVVGWVLFRPRAEMTAAAQVALDDDQGREFSPQHGETGHGRS